MDLVLTKTVQGTPDRVFDAFVKPESMSIWFTTKAEADLRVGGTYRNADGDRGEFLQLDRPNQLEFTWDNPGHCPGTRVRVNFVARTPTETLVTLTHSELPTDQHVTEMTEGWSWALESFEQYIRTGHPITFESWKTSRG